MVATIATAASADYYIHAQASHRPVEEYYLSGEEPDGVWWNPAGLFGESRAGMGDGGTVDSADFHRLYNGFHPATGEKLTRNAGSAKRCPGYDLIFNADKTVSALWAVAPPELRKRGSRRRTTTRSGSRLRTSCSGTARIPGSGTGKGRSGRCPPTSRRRCSATAPRGRTTRISIPTA